MEEATLCADGWACARSAQRVLRVAMLRKRHRLRPRYRSVLILASRNPVRTHQRDGIGTGPDRNERDGTRDGTRCFIERIPANLSLDRSVGTRELGTRPVKRSGPDTFRHSQTDQTGKKPFQLSGMGHFVSPSRSRRIWSFAQSSRARSSAGIRIPGGTENRIAAGGGDPFSHKGETDPQQRRRLEGGTRDGTRIRSCRASPHRPAVSGAWPGVPLGFEGWRRYTARRLPGSWDDLHEQPVCLRRMSRWRPTLNHESRPINECCSS
jgi:hypothetical protein